MARDQVHIPLGQELKAAPFRQHHAQHRVRLLHAAFLTAAHRITVVDACALDFADPSLQRDWVTEFRAAVRIIPNSG